MECCLVLRVQGPGSESGRDCNSEKGIVGVNDDEDPPVPIPNTVVKLVGAEDTWLETTREQVRIPIIEEWYPNDDSTQADARAS